MTIQFGEITVVRDYDKESFAEYFDRLLGGESFTVHDRIILLFQDGTIYDTTTLQNDIIQTDVGSNFTFGSNCFNNYCPQWLSIYNKNKILSYKTQLDFKYFNKIFKNYKNYTKVSSLFNCIYEDDGNNLFLSIVKIESSKNTPRFIFAYEETIFDKSNIIYLIDFIIKNRHENNNVN